MISDFNNLLDQKYCKNYFYSYLIYLRPNYNLLIIKSVSVIYQIFTKTANVCQCISFSNHDIKFQQPSGPEIMQKLFSSLLDTSTTKIQSSHHKIIFSVINQIFTKLQIYVNTLVFQTISSFNNPLDQK